MSKIALNKELVGKINFETLQGMAHVPEWLQPYVKYNGVYVGTEEPTDNEMLVWINPEGEGEEISKVFVTHGDLDPYALKEDVAKEYATKEYVEEMATGGVSLDNYYTKDETNHEIETAVQSIDLTPYATKVELEQYDTSNEVDAKIAAIEIPETDLTGYAKETWVTEQLNPYALKTEIPDTSNFATKSEIPSLDGYATESYVDEKLADVDVEVPVATVDTLGIVKPDGVTIIIKDGVLTAVGGGGGVFETPTQTKNDLRLFQGLTVLQINNGLEVY